MSDSEKIIALVLALKVAQGNLMNIAICAVSGDTKAKLSADAYAACDRIQAAMERIT